MFRAEIVGREREHRLIAAIVRDGGALLLRGEPGAGKTALLDRAAAGAPMRVLRAAGSETTADIPYAALAELLRPLRAELRERADAGPLRMALGMEPAGHGRWALEIEVALEELLTAHAPLLVIVDDVHWLDDASARVVNRLARAARQLGIAVLLAARPVAHADRGVDELTVDGLDPDAATTLLRGVDPGLAPDAIATLVEATAGNPLGLIELPRTLSAGQRFGTEPITPGGGVTERLVAAFGDRIRRLPAPARLAVITAAAADPDDAPVLPGAFTLLGLATDALDAAEHDGLLRVDEAIRFRHPLVRMAALGDSSAAERRRVETALGAVVTDLERRTWHRARATAGTDDALADELVRVAEAASVRIAYSAQSRLLVEAARLTCAPEARADLLVRAACSAFAGGSTQRAADLLDAAEVSDPASVRTTAGLLVRLRLLRTRGETEPMLEVIDAAVAVSDRAPAALAIIASRQAATQRLMVADPDAAVPHADAALARAGDDPWLRFLGHEASAMTYLHAGRVDVALAHCRSGLELVDADFVHPYHIGTLDHISTFALTLMLCEWYTPARRLHAVQVRRHRQAGNPYFFVSSLCDLAELLRRTGDLPAAQVAAEEANALAEQLRDRYLQPLCATVLAHIRMLRGDRDAVPLAEAAAAAPGEPGNRTLTAAALAAARLLAGDPAGALAALAPVVDTEPDGFREPNHSRALAPRLEALIALERRDEAAELLDRVEKTAGISTRWTRSCLARFRGVLADDLDEAESAFAAALAELDPSDGPIEHGLIRLDHGRWLRRAGRRRAAREVLQQAHADFTGSGAAALADLAARDIGATAPRLRPRAGHTGDELTTRETEIAEHAATGATDRDIAATLYISTRTVDYHLRNIFRKLGIRSRAELAARIQRVGLRG